jgi:hypothetical protein
MLLVAVGWHDFFPSENPNLFRTEDGTGVKEYRLLKGK